MFDKDPVWFLFNNYFHINSRSRSLLYALIIGGMTFVAIPLITGYFFPRTDGLSALSDWPGFVITFFTHPAIYLYYCYEQENLINKFLIDFERVQSSKSKPAFQQYINNLLNHKVWPLLGFFFTAIGYFLHTQAVLAHPSLSYYYPNLFVLYFVNAVFSALAGYMVSLISIRYLIVVFSLYKGVKNGSLDVVSSHFDGCGGYSFIGRFIQGSIILVAIMAIDLSLLILINLQQTQRDPLSEPSLLSFLCLYFLLLPIGFLLPLFIPRMGNLIIGKGGLLQDLPFTHKTSIRFAILFLLTLTPIFILLINRFFGLEK